ncbi:MAG TPA: DUF2085 domain-containing protein [Anaerolineaceae bacterium]|nr:DUF2085 domain-containing protein [Anaerolineaceae bacterium]
MITVTLYRKTDCAACDQAQADLDRLQATYPHSLVVMDLAQNNEFQALYGNDVPVVEAGPYKLRSPFSIQDLQAALGAASDRHVRLEQAGDTTYLNRLERGHTLNSADKISYWLSRHYVLLFSIVIFVYVGLPFLAPISMVNGWKGVAKAVYTIYSPLCHQFAFRSWFLYGEQLAYPRELAHVNGLVSYEQATGLSAFDVEAARDFIGNAALGYKVALCERDIAIYGSILLFGIIFSLTGRRLKSIPWYLWVLLGMVPMGIDGVSQLPGLLDLPILAWLPIRESTPFLRTLTGALFGFSTAWYGYPYIEETMAETRRTLSRKIAVIKKDQSG